MSWKLLLTVTHLRTLPFQAFWLGMLPWVDLQLEVGPSGSATWDQSSVTHVQQLEPLLEIPFLCFLSGLLVFSFSHQKFKNNLVIRTIKVQDKKIIMKVAHTKRLRAFYMSIFLWITLKCKWNISLSTKEGTSELVLIQNLLQRYS